MLFFCRHPKAALLRAHVLVDAQHVWHFLHSGGARALLDRRFRGVLHHLAAVPLLSHAGQQSSADAARLESHESVVPVVQFLRVVGRRDCAQRVRVAACDCLQLDRFCQGQVELRVVCVQLSRQEAIADRQWGGLRLRQIQEEQLGAEETLWETKTYKNQS